MSKSEKMYIRINEKGKPVSAHAVPGEIYGFNECVLPITVDEGNICPPGEGHRHPILCIAYDDKHNMRLFSTPKEAYSFRSENNGWKAALCPIIPQELFPVKVPFVCYISKGDKGLMTKLNLRPDLEGRKAFRVYFPDKSVKDARDGFMLVTSVAEHGNYGFLSGKMIMDNRISGEHLYRYLINNISSYNKGSLCWVQSGFSASLTLVNNQGDNAFVFSGPGGEILPSISAGVFFHSETLILRSLSVEDYILQYNYHATTKNQLKELVEESDFDRIAANPTPKSVSELIDVAQDIDFVRIFECFGITIARFNCDVLYKAAESFNSEDMRAVIDEVNQLNSEASVKLKSKIKKGQISAELIHSAVRKNPA